MSQIRGVRAVLVFAVLLCAAPAEAGSGYAALAKRFARAASRAEVDRIAVLPFAPLDGSDAREGRVIAERLTSAIAGRGDAKVVERDRMTAVLSEHRLGTTGLVDPGSLTRVGRMLQAGAIVTGTFLTLGDRVELHARLIDIESGAILAARRAHFKRRFFARGRRLISEPEAITPFDAISEALEFQKGWRPHRRKTAGLPGFSGSPPESDLRDAIGGGACANWTARVDRMERSILPLKARYWAGEIRKHDLSLSNTKRIQSEMLSDPNLRRTFTALLDRAVRRRATPLTPGETRRFVRADSAAFILRMTCRGGSPYNNPRSS